MLTVPLSFKPHVERILNDEYYDAQMREIGGGIMIDTEYVADELDLMKQLEQESIPFDHEGL